ncbi:hypothetical protein Hypma_008887 [Hypsizygus marmoreus]|uniref:Uncharacterized protein n=1 Tax=Hypsizygus marmoreus TaxID=39966 RepID=A0A369JQR4_HYPMA|nr:hypothetical protein Hypma_008887 [Hypsizygus marmoreus]
MPADDSHGAATHHATGIHQLPLEVIREIFVHCLTCDRAPNNKLAPLLLCHVCSMWRNLALSTPQLWSELSMLCLQGDVAKAMRTFTNATELWFRCVGRHCPFSYTVRLPRGATAHAPGKSLLFPLPPSIYKLDLTMEDDSQLTEYAYLQTEAPAFLVTAKIAILHESPLSLAMRDFPFDSAPRLRNLMLDVAGDGLPIRVTPAPWKLLTQLILGRDIQLKAWHKIIRQCPLLKLCSVELDVPFLLVPPTNLPVMTFNHLEDLTLLFSSGAFLDAAVAGLSFPALTSLHLSCEDDVAFDLTSESTLRIFRDAQLTYLTLRQGQTESDDLYNVLEITNTLTSLDITCDSFFLDLFCALRHDADDNPVLLPQLEHLTLGIFHYGYDFEEDQEADEAWYFGGDLLLDLVKSRWWPGGKTAIHPTGPVITRLRKLSLVMDSQYPKTQAEVANSLLPLKEAGLSVDVQAGLREEWSNSYHMQLQWHAYMDD